MTKPNHVSILHVSDLHYSKRKSREIEIVVKALLDDVRKICIGHRKPDLIVFSGDLVQSSDEDNPDEAFDALIGPLLQASGCSEERVIICPGNHDGSRLAVSTASDMYREVRAKLNTKDELNYLNSEYLTPRFVENLSKKFEKNTDLHRFIKHGSSREEIFKSEYATLEFLPALNLQIVRINSAAFSTCGIDGFDKDITRLAVPEYALIDVERHMRSGATTISIMHHPFEFFSEESGKIIRNFISKNSNCHLFGHMHDPVPQNIVSLRGSYVESQCGAIFTSRRDAYIGYSLIISDSTFTNVEVLLRSFFPERTSFDAAVDIIEGGRWWSSNGAKAYFARVAEPIDDAEFRKHLSGKAYLDLVNREQQPGGFHESHVKFVPPPIKRNFIQERSGPEGLVKSSKPIQYSELVLGEANEIIYASPEYGRTTLLKELRYEILFQAQNAILPRLPALIEFDEIRSNADTILRRIRGAVEAMPPNVQLEALLEAGHLCVLVDDVRFSDRERMSALREFVTRFPKCRYILSTSYSSAIQFGASVDPEMPVSFEFIELKEFSRKEMRALLVKESRCTDVEGWLDRLQDEFRQINLPFTAANGTILIEILAEKYSFNPINRSVLMEQFIDTILSKASIEQSKRETFDYTNKTDLLSYVAAWMARNDKYKLKIEELFAISKEYIDGRGLVVDIGRILDIFFVTRIFIKRHDDSVSFRYKGVLEYFIAHRMSVDSEFKDWILEESRYLAYVNEIGFYAGKSRSDQHVLDLIGSRHRALFDELDKGVGGIDFSDFERFALPNTKDGSNGEIDDLARTVHSRPLSRDEKDVELEASFPKDAEGRQEVFRPDVRSASDRLWLSLILYSTVLKNLELIPDKVKRSNLREIWRGWSTFLHLAITVAPRLAVERKVRVNGALYEMQVPHGMSDSELLRILMLMLPNVHLDIISNALGTEKLEKQLCESTPEESDDPLIFKFLRAGLIVDLKLNRMNEAVRDTVELFAGKRYLLATFIRHVAEVRRFEGNRIDEFRGIEGSLAQAIADLRGGSKETKLIERARELKRLEHERLLVSVRADSDESEG